jgi:hypothetical protein
LREKLEAQEITPEAYYAKRRSLEYEADERVYRDGSPRSKIGFEGFCHKMCAYDNRFRTRDVTYSTHPHSCDRYVKAKEAVDKMLGPWADS